jgi:hypothetical protein
VLATNRYKALRLEVLNVKRVRTKEGRAGSPSRPFLRSEPWAERKKPRDPPVPAGGSEIRPYLGLRPAWADPKFLAQPTNPPEPASLTNSLKICERCRLDWFYEHNCPRGVKAEA